MSGSNTVLLGAPTPNLLITVHDGELGFGVGKGKFVVTASIQEGMVRPNARARPM